MVSPLKKILRRIPAAESLRGFLEQWGLWKWISAGFSLIVASALAAWSYITSNLPGWAVGLVFLGALALSSAVVFFAVGAWGRYRALTQDSAQPIDRMALADEAETLSRNLGSILADHAARMIVARERDNAALMADGYKGHPIRDAQTAEIAKTVDKVVERHATEMTMIIAKASRCSNVTVWPPVELRFASGYDIQELQAAFAKIAVELRHDLPIYPSKQWLEAYNKS